MGDGRIPLKTIKNDSSEALTLEWVLHVKNYRLNLDKHNCVGCQCCSLACPKEAIRLLRPPRADGEKAKRALVDIDLEKCNFCGICDVVCPYGAINVTRDGEHVLSVVEKESFPQLIRDVRIDQSKFPLDSRKSEEVCPLGLIQVSYLGMDGKTLEDIHSLNDSEKRGLRVTINVKRENCPCCGICDVKLPLGAMHVRKFFSGKLAINSEKCPNGCTDCLDVCPIKGTLYLSDDLKKVQTNEIFCVYCGACKVVCPSEGALDLERTRVSHTPVRSGAWNKALERLTSSTGMTKELKAKRSLKTRESVKKRMGLGDEPNV